MMTDVEIQRAILQFAYDHRHDHSLQIVGIEDIDAIKGVEQNRLRHNIKLLRDLELINTEDSAWRLIAITTSGTRLVDDKEEFDRLFPVRFDLPQQTQQLVDTVEELLSGKFDAPLRQFRKAKDFLYKSNPPDYQNCIKDSVGAVEAIAKILLNEPTKDLGKLTTKLSDEYLGHPAMTKIVDGIYAVRGDEPGVAHGAHDTSLLAYSDAEFIINVSSALITYLVRQSESRSVFPSDAAPKGRG
jgi:hypothetical protein